MLYLLSSRGVEACGELGERLNEVGTRRRNLPFGWVLAFFGALFVFLAHFLYQTRAHDRIRRQTVDAFCKERNDEFLSARPEQRDDLVLRALDPLRDVAAALPFSRHRDLVRRGARTVWIPTELGLLRALPTETDMLTDSQEGREPQGGSPAPGDPHGSASPANKEHVYGRAFSTPRPPHSQEELEVILVDEGARAEYDLASRSHLLSAAISGLLYLAALGCIAGLVWLQAVRVLRAAGFAPLP